MTYKDYLNIFFLADGGSGSNSNIGNSFHFYAESQLDFYYDDSLETFITRDLINSANTRELMPKGPCEGDKILLTVEGTNFIGYLTDDGVCLFDGIPIALVFTEDIQMIFITTDDFTLEDEARYFSLYNIDVFYTKIGSVPISPTYQLPEYDIT